MTELLFSIVIFALAAIALGIGVLLGRGAVLRLDTQIFQTEVFLLRHGKI